MFVPEHVTLVESAKEIERMVDEAVLPDLCGGNGTTPSPSAQIIVAKDGDGEISGAIQHSQVYTRDETQLLLSAIRAANFKADIAAARAFMHEILKAHGARPETTPLLPDPEEPDESKANDELVGAIVSVAKRMNRTKFTFEAVNAWANHFVGIRRKDKLTPVADKGKTVNPARRPPITAGPKKAGRS